MPVSNSTINPLGPWESTLCTEIMSCGVSEEKDDRQYRQLHCRTTKIDVMGSLPEDPEAKIMVAPQFNHKLDTQYITTKFF